MHSPTTLKLDPITMDYIKNKLSEYIYLKYFSIFTDIGPPGQSLLKYFSIQNMEFANWRKREKMFMFLKVQLKTGENESECLLRNLTKG